MTEIRSAGLLLIDAGHTRIKCAAAEAGNSLELPTIQHVRAVMLNDPLPWDEIQTWFPGQLPPVCCLVGSNPLGVSAVEGNWPARFPRPWLLSDKSLLPLEMRVEQPHRVGIDRLLNAMSANVLRDIGQTAVIVDSGTAITVDCVTSRGVFRGGAILPGVRMGALALQQFTATLPLVEANSLFAEPPTAIGRVTEAAIASGLYWGHVGAVRELILRVRDELASFDKAKDAPSLILMTGGAADLLKPHFPQALFEPHLALQGLALAVQHILALKPPTSESAPNF